jgi:hypothetical protein
LITSSTGKTISHEWFESELFESIVKFEDADSGEKSNVLEVSSWEVVSSWEKVSSWFMMVLREDFSTDLVRGAAGGLSSGQANAFLLRLEYILWSPGYKKVEASVTGN